MIKFNSVLSNLFSNPPVRFFFCVKIYKGNIVLKAVTTHPSNVVLSDNVTYVADGSLQSVDTPSVSSTVSTDRYRIQLADPFFAEGPFVEQGIIGCNVEIRTCFLDTDGTPLTNLSDTLLAYSGYGDGTSFSVESNEVGETVVQLTCTSPMGDLDFKKYIYLTKDFIRGRNPTDSCCDAIYGGSGVLQLKWGKS
jgi:hypothetical protein